MIIATASIVLLLGVLCILAYWLATYALPFMMGFVTARLAYETGASLIGAGLIGVLAAMGSIVLLLLALVVLQHPVLRITAVLVFVGPAVLAGYDLVHGLTYEAVPSVVWCQIFSTMGGIFVGASALARLTAMLEGFSK